MVSTHEDGVQYPPAKPDDGDIRRQIPPAQANLDAAERAHIRALPTSSKTMSPSEPNPPTGWEKVMNLFEFSAEGKQKSVLAKSKL